MGNVPIGDLIIFYCFLNFYCSWCHLEMAGRVHLEVGWHQNAVYCVFGAACGGLDGSKWRSIGAGMHYISYLVPLEEGWVDPNGSQMAW